MIFFWLMMICCCLFFGCLIYDLKKDNDPRVKLLATAILVVVFYILFIANYRPQEIKDAPRPIPVPVPVPIASSALPPTL